MPFYPSKLRVFLVSVPLLSLWSKRSLIFYFSIMNVKLRYKGTNLGFFWNVLEPLFTFLVLYIVFTNIRDRPDDFGIYLLTGIMFYHVFTRGSFTGLGSLRKNRHIITSFNVQKEFFSAVAIGSIVLTTLVEMSVFLVVLLSFNFIPSWTIIFFPLLIIMMLVLVLGLTYFLSILNIYFKDIQPIWGIFIHVVFFISPIFWYVNNVDGILLDIMKINPVGQIIELSHQIVVYGQVPPLNEWLYTTGIILGILFVGYFIFKKYENKVAEEL